MIFVKKCADVIAAGKQLSVPALLREFDRSDSSGGAILKRLEELPDQFHASAGIDPKKLFSRPLYLGVHSVNKAAQKFLLYHLFLYFTLLHPAPVKYRLHHAFLIHESREFIRKDEATPFLGEVFRQIRNHGLATIWLEQDPSGVKDEIRANITSRVVFPETTLGSVARSVGLNKEQEEFIRAAPKRTAVVKRSDIPYPFVIRVLEFDYSRLVTPQEMQERRRQTIEYLRGPQPVKSTTEKPLADLLSDPDLLRLLQHIEANPNCPTTRRYAELGFRSVKKADRLRRHLIDLGLVEESRIKTGTQGGWYNALRLTPAGKSAENQEPQVRIKRESNA